MRHLSTVIPASTFQQKRVTLSMDTSTNHFSYKDAVVSLFYRGDHLAFNVTEGVRDNGTARFSSLVEVHIGKLIADAALWLKKFRG